MAADQSFAVATHAMVMMAFSAPELVSASAIAEELSLSPVVVRRTMSRLVKGDLIASFPGPAGGYRLIDEDVTLTQVLAVVHERDGVVGRFFEMPTSSCVEGVAVDGVVAGIYAEADAAVDQALGSWTIAKICQEARKDLP